MLNKILIATFLIVICNVTTCFAEEYKQVDLKTAINIAIEKIWTSNFQN